MEKNVKIGKRDAALLASLPKLEGTHTRTNPFSGESVLLESDAAALHDEVKAAELAYNQASTPSSIRRFRQSLDLFRKLYPDAYYTLLD